MELTRPSAHEFWLLKLLFLHENLVGWAATHLDPVWVQHRAVREIVVQRLAVLAGETWTSLGAFLDECESAEMQNLITEAVTEGRPIPNPELQLADVILRLRNQHLDQQIARLDQQISQPDVADAEKVTMLHHQQRLKQLKRQQLGPVA